MRIKSLTDLKGLSLNTQHRSTIVKALKAAKNQAVNGLPPSSANNAYREAVSAAGDPHKWLFDRLNALHPNVAVSEYAGLVPDRKFRADIYLPESGLVVEVDGFQFHRSKDKFQSDRDRRNLMTSLGYPVLAYYYARIKNDVDGVVAEIMSTHAVYKALRNKKGG